MIYAEIELRDTIKAINIINDMFRTELKDKVIEFTASNSIEISCTDVAESLNFELEDNDVKSYWEKDCETCNGEGVVEEFNCRNNSNECCGGCYTEYTCEDCNGHKKQDYDY